MPECEDVNQCMLWHYDGPADKGKTGRQPYFENMGFDLIQVQICNRLFIHRQNQ